jgi:hypothetical protein
MWTPQISIIFLVPQSIDGSRILAEQNTLALTAPEMNKLRKSYAL